MEQKPRGASDSTMTAAQLQIIKTIDVSGFCKALPGCSKKAAEIALHKLRAGSEAMPAALRQESADWLHTRDFQVELHAEQQQAQDQATDFDGPGF